MKTLKTIKQAVRTQRNNEPTAQNLINGRIETEKTWESFKISNEIMNFLARELTNIIGGHDKTKNKIFAVLKFRKPQHGLLNRFTIQKYNDNYTFDYCTGQDQPEEMKTLRNYLKKL